MQNCPKPTPHTAASARNSLPKRLPAAFWRYLLPGLMIFATWIVLLAVETPAAAQSAIQEPPPPAALRVEYGDGYLGAYNYCAACHQAGDPRVETVTAWKGGVEQEVNSPCPAAKRIHEELTYTEHLLLMMARARQQPGAQDAKLDAQIATATQAYSRLLDEPVTALDAFVSRAQIARYRLGKLYYTQNQRIAARKLQIVVLFAVLISLVVLGSLFWGLRNTQAQGLGRSYKLTLPALVSLLLILAFFALPIFKVPAAEVAAATQAEMNRQAVVDTAQRAAATADRAQARAWMLARIGASWLPADAQQGQAALREALAALQAAQAETDALWGTAQSVQEASVGETAAMQKAALIADQLEAARAYPWAAALVSAAWQPSDAQQAGEILQNLPAPHAGASSAAHDLLRRSAALAGAAQHPEHAQAAAAGIADPALRSWTQRELAALTGKASLYDLAAQAAAHIDAPLQRARALREIGTASGEASYFHESAALLAQAAQEVNGGALAYALADLAAASGDAALVERIDPAYPAARASALLRMQRYADAWQAAARIAEPYEQGRAQAAIAAASADAGLAGQIPIALYRDRALRDIVRQTGKGDAAEKIASPYYRVQALTALGQHRQAWESAGELSETYPLVALATAWADSDPQAALQVVDRMASESEKAAALRAIAVATRGKDSALFERALAMALAARVRGDALAAAQASLDLALDFLPLDAKLAQMAFRQAYAVAQKISIK